MIVKLTPITVLEYLLTPVVGSDNCKKIKTEEAKRDPTSAMQHYT